MRRHVGNHDGLRGGQCDEARSTARLPRGSARTGLLAHLFHGHLAASPGTGELDGVAGAIVSGTGSLEVVQHVGGAIGGPQGQEAMVGVGERASSSNRDEAGVRLRAQDHA